MLHLLDLQFVPWTRQHEPTPALSGATELNVAHAQVTKLPYRGPLGRSVNMPNDSKDLQEMAEEPEIELEAEVMMEVQYLASPKK